LLVDASNSKIAEEVNIYMELHPGTSINAIDRVNVMCNSKWNAIRKAYAQFTGTPYIIPPVYRNTPQQVNTSYTRKGGKWSEKYKKSIDCNNPKGFSQKQHCKYGRKTRKNKKV